MYRLHLTRNLRSLAFVLTILAVLAGLFGLWWANHTGLPEPWRATIEREVEKQGMYIKIGSLRYVPLRGVIATDVRFFSDPEHSHEISRLEHVILDFAKTKLARGVIHLNKIQLNHARLLLPVDPKNPSSETLSITDAYGTLYMPGERRLEIRDARGKIAGIEVRINARLIGYQQDGTHKPEESTMGKRRELLARVINELEKWKYNTENPPMIEISMAGNVNDRSSITAKMTLSVRDMEKNGHRLDELSAEAALSGDILTITSLHASDRRGVFRGQIDYNLQDQEGRFDVFSSLEIPRLMTAWLGLPTMRSMNISGDQTLEAQGEFQVDENHVPHLQLTGHARCESVQLNDVSFDSVEFAFSSREDRTFLQHVSLVRPDGLATGKAMIEWPSVRLQLHSTLPVSVY